MHQQGLRPRLELLSLKLNDRQLTAENFINLFTARQKILSESSKLALEFYKEMHRFLPAKQILEIEKNNLWNAIVYLLNDLGLQSKRVLGT